MKIAWMYPDTLFLHGDRGNVLALERYAGLLGADVKVDKIDFETEGFDPMSYDILYFGAGEISSFESIVTDMESYREGLVAFIEAGKPLVATGTTMAMFGQIVDRTDKSGVKCMPIMPILGKEREYVYGDDLYIEADYFGRHMEIIGVQIQMADILHFREGEGYKVFGNIIYGMGNNGRDGIEGVMYKNSIFTNLLGPVLLCNPWLTCAVIRAAAEASGETLKDKDPAFELELKSLEAKKDFIRNKKPGAMGQ